MGMITESQIVSATQQTNELLGQLIAEVRHTNALLEWLGQVVNTGPTGSPAAAPPPNA